MLYNLRNRLPDVDDAREIAVDRAMKAANSAAELAREVSDRLEDWAADGLDSVRSRPLMWTAASLGLGILVGGLFAVWQNAGRRNGQTRRTVAARSSAKPKRRTSRSRRMQPSADA